MKTTLTCPWCPLLVDPFKKPLGEKVCEDCVEIINLTTCPRCLEPAVGEKVKVPGGLDPDEKICVECAEAERNDIAMDEDHQHHIDALDEEVK